MQGLLVLERFAKIAASRRDLVIVALIVTAIAAMVIPITPTIADILISLNIGLSVTLLMVAIYVHSPTEFSALPSVILITTVFRLSISVAATRLILLEADGGKIVQTFGDFVIAGNVVVGLLVFLIITVVQFIVITKGAERVAEVAARFSLDGLPGKQMSIDSDLRNGDIDQMEARRRRQVLEQESQLYGAMDGAMKFVKGDAIAGIAIIAINLLGGIAVGMVQHGLSFTESTHVFSLLTIGEGLVAQIPALFISLTAGTVVTRVTGAASKNLGSDIISQLASRPEALGLAAAVLLILSGVPGFPTPIFAVLAAGLATANILLHRKALRISAFSETDRGVGVDVSISAMIPQKPVASVNVLVGADTATQLREDVVHRNLLRIAHEVADDLGFPTPGIGYRVAETLPRARYLIELDMVPEIVRDLNLRAVYASTADREAIQALGTEVAQLNSPSAPPVLQIDADAVPALEAAKVRTFTTSELLELDLSFLLRRNAAYFLGLQETRRLLAAMEADYKDLVRETQRVSPPQRIAEVLRRLLEEGVPIRNMRLILEAILEWAPKEQDIVGLTGRVRHALKRQICYRVAGADRAISVLLLERETEDAIRVASQEATARNMPMLDAEFIGAFRKAVQAKIENIPPRNLEAAVVLASADIRRLVWTLFAKADLAYSVLSYQEIAPEFTVRTLATIPAPIVKRPQHPQFAVGSAQLAQNIPLEANTK